MDASLLQRLALAARQAVGQAGEIIKANWRRPKTVQYKGPRDLLTETDLAVEQALTVSLAALLPGAAFLGEETSGQTGDQTGDPSGDRPGDQSRLLLGLDRPTWIVDPVDGTTNFAHGLPLVATSVGLWAEGRIQLGIVNLPILDEMFWAVRGQGAFLGQERLSVSTAPNLSRGLVATGFPYRIPEFLPEILRQMEAVLQTAQGLRRMGAASVDLAYVACGRLDGFYEFDLKPWDTAAGWLLVEEAGGRVSRFDALKPYALGAPTILATNGLIHEEMAAILA